MDSTYGTTAERYPLYVLAAQDGSGYTRPVAVGFITSDTSENIAKFISLFKECHTPDEVAKTTVIFVDKDRKELAALRQEMKNAWVLLCWFHVIRAVSTKVSSLELRVEQKQAIFAIFQKCLYARSARVYLNHLEEMEQQAPPEFLHYFSTNWDSCRLMWVAYHRSNLRTFGNNTTNRVEGKHTVNITQKVI